MSYLEDQPSRNIVPYLTSDQLRSLQSRRHELPEGSPEWLALVRAEQRNPKVEKEPSGDTLINLRLAFGE